MSKWLSGDRPIEVTLQRAWQALTWRQRLDLGTAAMQLASSGVEVDADTVEQLKSDDAVAAFESALTLQYPKVWHPSSPPQHIIT